MPAGVGWGEYLRAASAAALSMFIGAQTVHTFYKPLKDMDQLVQNEKMTLKQEMEIYKKELLKEKYPQP